jgi:hypothetical protein
MQNQLLPIYTNRLRVVLMALLVSLYFGNLAHAQKSGSDIITSDITNFWTAYDKIITTEDSAQQYTYINKLFIDKGTPGLKAMMQVREYTAKSYINAIHKYPRFWNSIRSNTVKAPSFAKSISANVLKIKKLYPELKPANVYFTIGALRSGGTVLENKVLIGSEITMADEHTVTDEFPQTMAHLKSHFKTNPINGLVFTNVHEYIHTQQKTTVANNLLGQCVLEGVAEFVAEKATGQLSTLPAKTYGNQHTQQIKEVFSQRLFNSDTGFWLYSNAKNEFGVRDLGYYVGYAICESYYMKARDKKQAIKEMIELDYNNEEALNKFADQSGYFNKPLSSLKSNHELNRPVVTAIKPFVNGATGVAPGVQELTIQFSKPMDKGNRNFELGPLGKDNMLKIKRFLNFSEDGTSVTMEVELKPGLRQQTTVGSGFISEDGLPLKPYLIDITTANQ